MPERMVVIGGDAAGMSAASQLRRLVRRRARDHRVRTRRVHLVFGVRSPLLRQRARRRGRRSHRVIPRRTPCERHRCPHFARGRRSRSRPPRGHGAIDGTWHTDRGPPLRSTRVRQRRRANSTRPPQRGAWRASTASRRSRTDGVRDHVERSQHPKVVVVGGGYVGLEMKPCASVELDVVLVDRSANR